MDSPASITTGYNGNGTFTDVFTSTGLDARGDKHGNGLCDYDNDGYLDLHITIGARGGSLLGEKSQCGDGKRFILCTRMKS